MDFYPNHLNLFQYLDAKKKSLSLRIRLHILSNLANGLRFLNKKKIVHMDLTPANILLSGV